MKKIAILFLFVLVGCNSFKVLTDYADGVNFSAYKTYNFFENSGENLSDFDKKRVQTAIESYLQKEGFTYAEKPDFFVDFNLSSEQFQNTNTIGIGIGGGGRNGGFGLSGGIPIGGNKLATEILVEFLSAGTETLFWKGSLKEKVNHKMTPQEKNLRYDAMVQKILMEYPPNKKPSNN